MAQAFGSAILRPQCYSDVLSYEGRAASQLIDFLVQTKNSFWDVCLPSTRAYCSPLSTYPQTKPNKSVKYEAGFGDIERRDEKKPNSAIIPEKVPLVEDKEPLPVGRDRSGTYGLFAHMAMGVTDPIPPIHLFD